MCLDTRMNEKEKKRYIRNLPKEFFVYKVMYPNGETEYGRYGKKLYKRRTIYKAEYSPERKRRIIYNPGFHVFRTKKAALDYHSALNKWGMGLIIRKFKAKKEWVTEVGKYTGIRTLVLSHIETL